MSDPFILAAIFVLHNFEEWLSFDQMPKLGIGKKYFNRKSFLFAIITLSILVAIFSFHYFQKLHLIILFSLMINSLQHGILSIWYRRVVPGTFSALFLMLPFSIFYFARLIREGKIDFFTLIENLILSPIVMGFSIWTTLWFGNYLFSNKHKRN